MTISLPTAMLAKIEHARQVEDRTRSEFVRQAIRVYLAHTDPERRAAEMGDGAADSVRGRAREADGAHANGDDVDHDDGRMKDAAGRMIDKVVLKDDKDRL